MEIQGDILVTPSKQYIDASPGEKVQTSVTVKNITREPGTVTLIPATATLDASENVTIDERGGENKPVSWITLREEPIELAPDQSIEVPVTLVIPQEVEKPLSEYPAVIIELQQDSLAQNAVALRSRIVSYILPNIRMDNVVNEIKIETFQVKYNERFNLSNTFLVKVSNESNRFLSPVGFINITDPSGKRLTPPSRFNEELEILNPGSYKEETVEWLADASPKFGFYTAQIEIQIDDKMYTAEDSFFVIPQTTLLTGLIALLLLVSVGVLIIYKKLKKR